MNTKKPIVSWESLPANIAKLRESLAGYEETLEALRLPRFPEEPMQDMTRQIREMRKRLNEVWSPAIARELRNWINRSRTAKPSIRNSAFVLGGLLLFVFPEHDVHDLLHNPKILDDLPDNIKQLASKWQLESEGDISLCTSGLTKEDTQELRAAGRELRSKAIDSVIIDMLEQHPIDKYAEAAWVYFLLLLMDELGLA